MATKKPKSTKPVSRAERDAWKGVNAEVTERIVTRDASGKFVKEKKHQGRLNSAIGRVTPRYGSKRAEAWQIAQDAALDAGKLPPFTLSRKRSKLGRDIYEYEFRFQGIEGESAALETIRQAARLNLESDTDLRTRMRVLHSVEGERGYHVFSSPTDSPTETRKFLNSMKDVTYLDKLAESVEDEQRVFFDVILRSPTPLPKDVFGELPEKPQRKRKRSATKRKGKR